MAFSLHYRASSPANSASSSGTKTLSTDVTRPASRSGSICESSICLGTARSLEDSGYGGSVVDSLTERLPPLSPIIFLSPLSIPALQEALTTQLSHVPPAAVADLTGKVKNTIPHAVAHGGFSDIHYGELECETSSRNGHWHIKTHPVAIKLLRVLTRQDLDGVRLKKRLDREVHVWRRLSHVNIANFFGTTYHMGGRPAMVMQWYKYGSATRYLKVENPEADRLMLIQDIAQGLNYLHTLQPPIVHGDLKGNNILITDDHHAVISDFGLSKVIEELVAPTGNTTSSIAGSVRWQAPELIFDYESDCEDQFPQASTVTRASDVWAFGCTAYELLTGNIPYSHRRHDWLVIQDILRESKPARPEDGLFSEIRDDIWQLLDSCWSFSDQKRPLMDELEVSLCRSRWK